MSEYCFLYYLCAANKAGEIRHAQTVMRELAKEHGFTITQSRPESAFDAWLFWIEAEGKPELPEFLRMIEDREYWR